MFASQVKTATTEALTFTAQDCFEAIQANPDNPKVPEYFTLRKACLEELGRRATRSGGPAHQPDPHTNSQPAPNQRRPAVLQGPSAPHINRE